VFVNRGSREGFGWVNELTTGEVITGIAQSV
jgi:hypothetical protein